MNGIVAGLAPVTMVKVPRWVPDFHLPIEREAGIVCECRFEFRPSRDPECLTISHYGYLGDRRAVEQSASLVS